MKTSHATTYLLIGLYFVNFAPALVTAQQQISQAATQTGAHASVSTAYLEKRLQEADQELATIREQMSAALTDEAKRALLERIEHLEQRVQQIRREVEVAKRPQQSSSAVDNSATSGCCELGDTSAGTNNMQFEDRAYCKWGTRNAGLQGMSDSTSVNETCLTGSRVIQSQRLKHLTVDLANDRGQLTRGKNEFCIEFRGALDNRPADPGKVQAEATMEVRGVKAIRAVVRLSQADVGRYCAHVDFPLPGSWAIEVEHKGPSGKGKAVFPATVN